MNYNAKSQVTRYPQMPNVQAVIAYLLQGKMPQRRQSWLKGVWRRAVVHCSSPTSCAAQISHVVWPSFLCQTGPTNQVGLRVPFKAHNLLHKFPITAKRLENESQCPALSILF